MANAATVANVVRSGQETYRIEKPLGAGAFGITFKAVDSKGEVVALKLMYPYPRSKSSFDTEIEFKNYFNRVLKDSCDPNMLCYHDSMLIYPTSNQYKSTSNLVKQSLPKVSSSAEVNYILKSWNDNSPIGLIVTSFINGQDLQQLTEKNIRFNARTTALFANQMLNALTTLHANHIYHRDIKPANIMLSVSKSNSGKQELTFILIDFGLACFVDRSQNRSTCNGVAGTEYYMTNRLLTFDHRTERLTEDDLRQADIFALAMSLYEMIVGQKKLPFPYLLDNQGRQTKLKDYSRYNALQSSNYPGGALVDYIFFNYTLPTRTLRDRVRTLSLQNL